MKLKRQKSMYMEQKSKEQSKIITENTSKFTIISPENKNNNKKLNVSRKTNTFNVRNLSKNSFYNLNKSKYSSFNNSFNENRNIASSIKMEFSKNNSSHIGNWCSNIIINNDNKQSIFINELFFKKYIINKNKSIIFNIKNKLERENSGILKKHTNLKNFLKKEDFFFSKIN